MTICYIGIGSNLGSRYQNIKLALKQINSLKDTKSLRLSRIIETYPFGGLRHQGKFLNAALKIKTRLSSKTLLKKLKDIEKSLGRVKTVRWGPRIIDLDILFYGDKIINSRGLKIPHPKVFERDFVLRPLLEIL